MRSSALAATEPKRATETIALRRILVCMTDSLLWLFSLSDYGSLENPTLLEIQVKWTDPRARQVGTVGPGSCHALAPRGDPGTASFTRHRRGHGLTGNCHGRGHGLAGRRRSGPFPAGLLAQPPEDDVEHRDPHHPAAGGGQHAGEHRRADGPAAQSTGALGDDERQEAEDEGEAPPYNRAGGGARN